MNFPKSLPERDDVIRHVMGEKEPFLSSSYKGKQAASGRDGIAGKEL